MSTPVTKHFTLEEMACHDGTPYPVERIDDNDPLRRSWAVTRLAPLLNMLETIRAAAGFERMFIDSGFRTTAYNSKLAGAASDSQHCHGRAADVVHERLTPEGLHDLILDLYRAGRLPQLGGIGLYPGWVHVDVRPRPGSQGGASDGHLAYWTAGRVSNRPSGI